MDIVKSIGMKVYGICVSMLTVRKLDIRKHIIVLVMYVKRNIIYEKINIIHLFNLYNFSTFIVILKYFTYE
jgi:hypothetical protein